MTIYERLLKFLDYKRINTSRFEQMCGMSNGSMSKLSDNTRRSTYGKIEKAFPDLNIEWLKTGKGQMLIESNLYMVAEARPKYSANIEAERDDLVPLLPVEAMAGSLSGLSESVMLRDCRWIKSPIAGADFAIQVTGDSMEPEIHNGTYLYIRKMKGAFIPWNHTVVIDTDDGVVVKKILKSENDKEYVIARSVNPDYPDFEIDKSSIHAIYRVIGGTFINSTI